ncbi:hypothetical protein CYMTET_54285 [Cymbomonas tetramitiformis]|uniref:Uncharacterized protein n=1 Tax=Cymbomonas tetramitiformis TaxID=36881 RepID=A0AAE0ENW2_9CHLO|nr:hypothetical protein CYMTET_54285 [Cymbomonas tetramitiformis]
MILITVFALSSDVRSEVTSGAEMAVSRRSVVEDDTAHSDNSTTSPNAAVSESPTRSPTVDETDSPTGSPTFSLTSNPPKDNDTTHVATTVPTLSPTDLLTTAPTVVTETPIAYSGYRSNETNSTVVEESYSVNRSGYVITDGADNSTKVAGYDSTVSVRRRNLLTNESHNDVVWFVDTYVDGRLVASCDAESYQGNDYSYIISMHTDENGKTYANTYQSVIDVSGVSNECTEVTRISEDDWRVARVVHSVGDTIYYIAFPSSRRDEVALFKLNTTSNTKSMLYDAVAGNDTLGVAALMRNTDLRDANRPTIVLGVDAHRILFHTLASEGASGHERAKRGDADF